ncbi:MAG TPA: hypothetical protein PK262_06510, partial [Bacteroidales bacterium]|nr:hypothetical protein [Bacteroidales bacterium]
FYLYKVLCSGALSLPLTVIVVNCLQFFIFTRFFAVFISKNLVNKGKELFISIKKTAKNILKYCFGSIFFVLIFIPNSAIESNL